MVLKGTMSRDFEVFSPSTNLLLKIMLYKIEYENTEEIIINHKGTTVVKDGEL